MKRHSDISFRAGSRLKASYFLAFNPETVNQFFDLFERLMSTYNFPPNCMLNGDESQVPTPSGEKLIAPKFFRRVRALDTDKHSHVTMLPFINAAGQALPCVIFVLGGEADIAQTNDLRRNYASDVFGHGKVCVGAVDHGRRAWARVDRRAWARADQRAWARADRRVWREGGPEEAVTVCQRGHQLAIG